MAGMHCEMNLDVDSDFESDASSGYFTGKGKTKTEAQADAVAKAKAHIRTLSGAKRKEFEDALKGASFSFETDAEHADNERECKESDDFWNKCARTSMRGGWKPNRRGNSLFFE